MNATILALVIAVLVTIVDVAGTRARDGDDGEVGQVVRLWDRFEGRVENPRDYDDPYRDVVLQVTFTRPDGEHVPFWGFHDGESIWRFRFMPDAVGSWTFAATFSDGAPGASGRFECVEAGSDPGPVSVLESNPIWFGRRGGGPLVLRGLHVGDRFFARNWPDEQRKAFLDWAQEQGYNTLSIASHYLNRDQPGRGRGWQTPDLWPLDAEDDHRVEAIYDDLRRRGMIVFPFAGFFGRGGNLPESAEDRDRYIRHVIARFGSYPNQLWNVAGPEPLLRGKSYLSRDEVVRLGHRIADLDPFGHPLSVHNATGDDAFRDEPWLTFGTLQGPKTVDRQALYRNLRRNHHSSKPLLAQETLWSGNKNHIRPIGRDYSDADLRKNAYTILFAGANFVFADNDGDSSSGFSGTLDLDDRRQGRHDAIAPAWDLFESLPLDRLRPAPDLDDGVPCLADPGRDYLAYLESPGPVTVRVGDGTFAITWIDARQPDRRIEGGTTDDGRDLSPPEGGEDWVAWLRRER